MLGDISPLERGRMQQFQAYNALTMPLEERAQMLQAGIENVGLTPRREALSHVLPGTVSAAGGAALGLISLPAISGSYQRAIDATARKPAAQAIGRVIGQTTALKVGEGFADPAEFEKSYKGVLRDVQGYLARKSPELVPPEMVESFVDNDLNIERMMRDPATSDSFHRGVREGLEGDLSSSYGEGGRLSRAMHKAGDPLEDAFAYAAKSNKMRGVTRALNAVRKRKLPILLGAAGLGGLLSGGKSLLNLSRMQKMDAEQLQEHLLSSDLERARIRGPRMSSLALPLLSLAQN